MYIIFTILIIFSLIQLFFTFREINTLNYYSHEERQSYDYLYYRFHIYGNALFYISLIVYVGYLTYVSMTDRTGNWRPSNRFIKDF
jgi:hypothetical protein